MEVPVLIKSDGQTPTILTRPLMAMDGNLLSAFWKSGACIPDKLIDKEDVLDELIDEVLLAMKLKTEIEDPGDLLDLIRNHRRGSTASSKRYNVKSKEKQRRSWGPDDTWSSRFVSKQSLKTDTKPAVPTITEKDEKVKKDSKLLKRSSLRLPSTKKSYKQSQTESLLNLRNCQPLNNFHNRGNNKRVNDEESEDQFLENAIMLNNDKKLKTKRRELMKMMSWICDEGYDYIHSEKVKNISEVDVFIDVMLSSSIPVQMTFKVNSPTDINITYQFLNTFKDDFMVLKISKTHCMVMRAF